MNETSDDEFQCLTCNGKQYARCDERKPDGSFGPGPHVRCVNCKAVYEHPCRAPEMEAGEPSEAWQVVAAAKAAAKPYVDDGDDYPVVARARRITDAVLTAASYRDAYLAVEQIIGPTAPSPHGAAVREAAAKVAVEWREETRLLRWADWLHDKAIEGAGFGTVTNLESDLRSTAAKMAELRALVPASERAEPDRELKVLGRYVRRLLHDSEEAYQSWLRQAYATAEASTQPDAAGEGGGE